MGRRRGAVIGMMIVALCLGGMLAACAGLSPASTPSRSAVADRPVVSATPTAEPTPTASAPTKPTLAELAIEPDGLGPLRIGSQVPTQPEDVAIVSFDERDCEARGKVGDPYVGAWLPTYGPSTAKYGSGRPFSLFTSRGNRTDPISVIMVWDSALKSERGIGAGSTRAALEAAYPDVDYKLHAPLTTMYVIDGTVGRMVFDVADTGDYWEPSVQNRVLWVTLQRKTVKAFSIAGSDAYGCGA